MFKSAFWGRGFRPFFFAGGLYAALAMPLWIAAYQGMHLPPQDTLFWHAHEMMFGFTAAIIAGFLLTAVANWTGGAPARQIHLASLVLLWLMGRIAMFLPELPQGVTLGMEGLFLLALTISLAIPLWRTRNFRNMLFIGLLTALWLCDMASIVTGSTKPVHVAILIVVVIISTIGGRIIPAFTVGALRRRGINAFQPNIPKADIAALGLGIASVVAYIFSNNIPFVSGALLLLAAGINFYRFSKYNPLKTFVDPMLWVLHAGFLWMVLGMAMLSLASFGIVQISTALHALTAGAIGTMCIGMMCRVALGHTGRDIAADTPTVIMFVLMQATAVIRVFGSLLWPDAYTRVVELSGGLWAFVFLFYVVRYAPVLFSPRPDGQTA
jgi:uncharacterized protein involved in response to NO